LPGQLTFDVLDLHPGRDEPDDLAAGALDRHRGLHLATERAVDALHVELPRQRRSDLAHEPLSDAVRQGVRVPDALGVHDHDEVDVGGPACRFGERLEDLAGVRGPQCRADTR
jgi:hypothetical protein